MRKIHTTIKRGFTVIELLVVISIVGMLSSLMLASLKTTRDKANDAKVKQQLRNMKNSIALFSSDNNGTYGSQVDGSQNSGISNVFGPGCQTGVFTDPRVVPYMDLTNYPSYVRDINYDRCIAVGDTETDLTANRYFVLVKLSNGNYYCVDSVGAPVERPQSYGHGLQNVQQLLNRGAGNVKNVYLVMTCSDLWC